MENIKKEITIEELIKIYGEDSVYRNIANEYSGSFYCDYLKLLPQEIKINPEVIYRTYYLHESVDILLEEIYKKEIQKVDALKKGKNL